MSQYRLTDEIEQGLASLAVVQDLINDGQDADRILTQIDHVNDVLVHLYTTLMADLGEGISTNATRNFSSIMMSADQTKAGERIFGRNKKVQYVD